MNSKELIRLKNTAIELRLNALYMIHKAQSGHPGGALSVADFVTACYFKFMNVDPSDPHWPERDRFVLSKANMLRDGRDVAIIANGDTVCIALDAAKALEAKGISARVLDMHTIKPLDIDAVNACIEDTGRIITVEDHNILNGLGSAVADVVAESGKAVLRRVGVQDQFGQSAPYERLLEMNGITVDNIVKQAEGLMG